MCKTVDCVYACGHSAPSLVEQCPRAPKIWPCPYAHLGSRPYLLEHSCPLCSPPLQSTRRANVRPRSWTFEGQGRHSQHRVHIEPHHRGLPTYQSYVYGPRPDSEQRAAEQRSRDARLVEPCRPSSHASSQPNIKGGTRRHLSFSSHRQKPSLSLDSDLSPPPSPLSPCHSERQSHNYHSRRSSMNMPSSSRTPPPLESRPRSRSGSVRFDPEYATHTGHRIKDDDKISRHRAHTRACSDTFTRHTRNISYNSSPGRSGSIHRRSSPEPSRPTSRSMFYRRTHSRSSTHSVNPEGAKVSHSPPRQDPKVRPRSRSSATPSIRISSWRPNHKPVSLHPDHPSWKSYSFPDPRYGGTDSKGTNREWKPDTYDPPLNPSTESRAKSRGPSSTAVEPPTSSTRSYRHAHESSHHRSRSETHRPSSPTQPNVSSKKFVRKTIFRYPSPPAVAPRTRNSTLASHRPSSSSTIYHRSGRDARNDYEVHTHLKQTTRQERDSRPRPRSHSEVHTSTRPPPPPPPPSYPRQRPIAVSHPPLNTRPPSRPVPQPYAESYSSPSPPPVSSRPNMSQERRRASVSDDPPQRPASRVSFHFPETQNDRQTTQHSSRSESKSPTRVRGTVEHEPSTRTHLRHDDPPPSRETNDSETHRYSRNLRETTPPSHHTANTTFHSRPRRAYTSPPPSPPPDNTIQAATRMYLRRLHPSPPPPSVDEHSPAPRTREHTRTDTDTTAESSRRDESPPPRRKRYFEYPPGYFHENENTRGGETWYPR